jgi:DNA-directed RNA polymerase subunit RPC12/RpoP
MHEFKFACPVCGQHIKCASSQAGAQMECPTCFQKIIVPQAPSTEDQKFILTGTKVGGGRPIPKISEGSVRPALKTKGFPVAIVALILIIVVAASIFTFRGNVFRPGPPVDVTRDPAAASSEENGHPAASGNDGNVQTRWCAANGNAPQWWSVDFGGMATITNVQIIWERDVAYKYRIEMSSDDIHWTVAADKSANAGAAQSTSDNFSATGEYLRVVVTGLPPDSWASFYELRASGWMNGHGK